MSTCGACPRTYRVGTMALVFSEKEPPARRRVCPECARRGLLVVAKTRNVSKVQIVRSGVVDKAIRMLTTYAKQATAAGLDGRAEGLESAIQCLKGIGGES